MQNKHFGQACMRTLLTSTLLGLSIASTTVSANNGCGGEPLNKYPVRYDDVVYTDTTRVRDGALYTGGTPLNGYRLIDVRIYRPAVKPGTGAPLRVPVEPIVYNGTFPNQPTVTSTMGFQLDRTWTNNTPVSGPFPLVVMFGGGGNSLNALRLAEEIASAGFIVAVPSGFGVDSNACPIPAFCTAAVARTQQRDARVVIDAAMAGQLGFPSTAIKQDSKGPVVGCVAGSLGSSVCLSAAAGATTTDANSLPGETSTDTRIRAVFVGDFYNIPSATFNNANLTQAFALINTGLARNWLTDFPLYSNASTRIFYELISREHRGSDISSDVICDTMSEFNRVYTTNVNTARDDALVGGVPNVLLGPAFAHCSQPQLAGFGSLPLTLPSSLPGLLPFTPLAGLLDDPKSDIEELTNYYTINFLRAFLNKNNKALAAATTASFPEVLKKVYVDAVPGIPEHDFNLQNKQIDMKLDAKRKQFTTTITNRSGPIPDPSLIPGAFSLFGNATWDDSISQITLPFAFPFQKGNLIDSTTTVVVNSNGYILPESNMVIIDGTYEARRLFNWFQDRGSYSIAALGNNLLSGAVGAGPTGKIWISSTPQSVQITWYQVQSADFPSVTLSAQCTLFPDGSVRLEYDNSIPAVIPVQNGTPGAIIVGMSNGRLHVNGSGKYNPHIKPKIVSFNDVLNGKTTKCADAIYEVYSRAVPAIGTCD